MTASLRVAVDPQVCIGAGECLRSAPEVFAQDENGVSGVTRPEPGPEQYDEVHEAVGLCPVQAIRMEWH